MPSADPLIPYRLTFKDEEVLERFGIASGGGLADWWLAAREATPIIQLRETPDVHGFPHELGVVQHHGRPGPSRLRPRHDRDRVIQCRAGPIDEFLTDATEADGGACLAHGLGRHGQGPPA